MKLQHLSWSQKSMIALKYIQNRLAGNPLLVTIEMTQYCNARCDFCNCWKTEVSPHLGDYLGMVKTLNPLVLALTGGEPLIRKDLPDIVRQIKQNSRWIYVYTVTNGSLLTEEKAHQLWDAGLDQLSISLNYLGDKQDEERQLEGLYEHIATLVPRLIAGRVDNILFNTVIMEENLDQITAIAKQAYEWGAKVSYSCYTDFKNGNGLHLISPERRPELIRTVEELIVLRSKLRNITNSEYYLRRIPEYFTQGGIRGCKAGKSFVQLTPDGYVRACPDFAPECHYTEYHKHGVDNHGCTKCWYSCRGETEGALTPTRVAELIKWG